MILQEIAEITKERIAKREREMPLSAIRAEAEGLSAQTGFPFEKALCGAHVRRCVGRFKIGADGTVRHGAESKAAAVRKGKVHGVALEVGLALIRGLVVRSAAGKL